MRKIILTSLFFCLAITTVFSQATIDIATPNSNGLSNNPVDDFDVNASGTILNNSASDGTAQLGTTTVTANPNITAGSEAELILFQVTSTSNTSALNGTIEVFGGEAGLIVANPNGITCDGCGFINTSKVDLVTGTANFSGDDLTGFSIDNGSQLQVNVNGFVSDAVADELNLVSRDLRIRTQAKANSTLRVLAGNDTYNHTTNIITSDTIENAVHSIQITGDLSADSIVLISTEISSSHGILNSGGDIEAASLKIDSNGLFRNQNSGDVIGDINISGLLEINVERFTNNANIIADIFSLSIPSQTSFSNTGTVSLDSLELTIGGDFAHDESSLNNFAINNFAITTMGNYSYSDPTNPNSRYVIPMDSSLRVFGDANIQADYFSNNNIVNVDGELYIDAATTVVNQNDGTISTDSLVVETQYYTNEDTGKVTANNATIRLSGTFSSFSNSSSRKFDIKNNLDIFTPIFENSGNITVGNILRIARDNSNAGITTFNNAYSSGNGTINADTFNLSVAGNFNYFNQYDQNLKLNGTITTNTLILTVGGNFSNPNGASDFIWATNDSLTVLGNADITTLNYNQFGIVDVAGRFDVTTTNNFVTNKGSTLNVADGLYVTVANGVFLGKNSTVINDSTIIADTFDFTVGGTNFSNQAMIIANNGRINLTHSNGILNNNSGEINVTNNFDITTDKLNNSRNIIVGDTLTVTLNSDRLSTGFVNVNNFNYEGIVADTFNFSVADDFDYLNNYLNEGTITTNALNLQVGGDFSYFYPASDFIWDANNSLTVLGNADITVNNYTQNGAIDVTGALTINVESDFDYVADFNGAINFNSLNLSVGGNFSNNDASNDFTWNTQNSLTVSGNADITADNYTQNGAIDVTGALTINVESDFDYVADFNGAINFNSLDLNVGGNFINNDSANNFTWNANNSLTVSGNADITTDNYTQNGAIDVTGALTINVGSDFDYVADFNGAIDFNSLNLNVGGNFINNDSANNFIWDANNSLTVLGNADITTDNYTQNGAIDVTGALTINVESDFDYVADFNGAINFNSLNLSVGGNFSNNDASNDFTWNTQNSLTVLGNADITANSFSNSGNITADALALSVAGDFDYIADFLGNGTITTNSLNLQVGGNFSNNDASNDFIWDAQNNLTVLGTADITATNLTNAGTINTNTLNTTLTSTASNSFSNVGVVSADTFSLSVVAGDFDYIADYLNNGTITTNSLNLQVGGDFSNNDASNNFTWNANDSLVVLGNADITVNNYTQNGVIDVAGALAISAIGDFTNFIAGSIDAATLAITVGEGTIDNDGTITTTSSLTIDTDTIHNSGNITATTSLTINATNDVFSGGSIETSALAIDAGRNFGISGTITTDSLNITAGYTALNTGTIVSGSLDLTTDDFFRNLAGGDISVDSLNITAGGKVTNIATITVGTLNIIANNDSSRTDDTTDFYVSNRGDITVTNLINITAVDNFYNTGNLTADTLAITAKDILLLNTDSIEPYDGGDISLNGDSSFIADGGDGVDSGIIVNRGNIDLGDNILDITADSFTNKAGANVTANIVNLTVNSFINDGSIDAVVIRDATSDQ